MGIGLAVQMVVLVVRMLQFVRGCPLDFLTYLISKLGDVVRCVNVVKLEYIIYIIYWKIFV